MALYGIDIFLMSFWATSIFVLKHNQQFSVSMIFGERGHELKKTISKEISIQSLNKNISNPKS